MELNALSGVNISLDFAGNHDSVSKNIAHYLAILTNTTNGFGYRTDDKGDTLGTAPALPVRA
jgi:hypothetical protein